MSLHTIDRMAVEDEGTGDPVVCLHGLGGSSNTWTAVMPALARYRVVRIDLPGSGRSPPPTGPLSIAKLVEAVRAVCGRLNIGRAHFLGHSMGTIVCQHLAADHAGLVRSLALFGPLPAPPDAARVNIRARATKARGEGAAGMQEIAQTLMNASTSADSRERFPAAAAFVRESLMRQDPEGYARNCEALADAKPAAVDRIEVGTLLVTGDEDGVAPPQAVRALAEKFTATRSGARVVVLSRCGHWTPIERPQDCMRELNAFLPSQR
ncbi:MAG: Hydrolase, alpha/beta fold family [uncultured Ramlibacter sp.]|uniref:Hydrolase, alpha/beta fold family n=1 Tax=uncultured Ramlibacter sp. TaxID=260755 RepID=A0A6J4QBT8_9BURK|nr:MAG: Hydrolase, alpha/beta fold family [uncultured Ramlibacter sp.]